jgi:hypothetical protein
MDVFAVLLHDVVHRRRVPGDGLRALLLAQIDAELIVARRRAALPVDVPAEGLVAATDDAEVADDIVLGGVSRDDRQTVDVALVSHGSRLPQSTLLSRP